MASMPTRFTPSVRTAPTSPTMGPAIITRRTDTFGAGEARAVSKRTAASLKLAGGGSPTTAPRPSAFGANTFGGTVGETIGTNIGGETGGKIGEVLGTFVEDLIRGRQSGGAGGFAPGGMTTCPEGTRRVGNSCVDLMALPPGGKPAVIPAGGTQVGSGGGAVIGSFGLPAMAPIVETRFHRSCGPGMVLGKDNLCYPKAILSRRSQFRKWRAAPRPPVSASDMKAIRKAASARERVKGLAKDVGFSVKKR